MHKIGNGHYGYDHHRVPGKQNVECTYLGIAGAEYTTSVLKDEGFTERAGYEERHKVASELERQEYGQKRFDELEKEIREKLKPGELAGKYQIVDGKIKVEVNEKIDKKFHKQIIYHEIEEAKIDMAKEGYKVNQEKTISKAMKHPDIPGAGAEKRKSIRDADTKFKVVMKEFERGTLFTQRGEFAHKVTDREQAQAIAYSEARKADEDYGR